MVICVDAKALEKPLFSDIVWTVGIWEKNRQHFLGFSADGFVIGDAEFTGADIVAHCITYMRDNVAQL